MVFAIGLIGFFTVSNSLPDDLDKTPEENGYEKNEALFSTTARTTSSP